MYITADAIFKSIAYKGVRTLDKKVKTLFFKIMRFCAVYDANIKFFCVQFKIYGRRYYYDRSGTKL